METRCAAFPSDDPLGMSSEFDFRRCFAQKYIQVNEVFPPSTAGRRHSHFLHLPLSLSTTSMVCCS